MGGGEHPPLACPTHLDLEPAVRFLREGERFVLAAHRGPDGDAIGSVLALAAVLEQLGKSVVRYNCDQVPYQFTFLTGSTTMTADLPTGDDWRLILLDCSEPIRAGNRLARWAEGRRLLVVDHHLTCNQQAEIVICDPQAASVGMLVVLLIDRLGAPISPEVAEAIYATIISDTGSFHYSNTTPAALRCSARMVELGVDPWRVASFLYEAEPLTRIRLLAEVLATLRLSQDGQCAMLLVTQEMLHRWQADDDLLDGFINYGRRVQGVEIAFMLREIRSDLYKCSMRSRGRLNVALIAQRFGGGGHRNAAGCQLSGDYAEVCRKLDAIVVEELARCTAS